LIKHFDRDYGEFKPETVPYQDVRFELTNPKTAIAQVMKLKDLIAYQSGAVVSKTLVNEEEGTVTAFAFDEGQGLSEHTAPYAALVIVIEGQVDVKISGESFHLNEGEMIIMPPNKPHALKAITQFKMILIMVKSR
ncbi:MAG: cupin domain-containing protein, partial [Candidatus Bathyarchaeia archaeon]